MTTEISFPRTSLGRLPRLGLGDACRLFGFTPRALRFYEERGLVIAHRDRLNCRFYDERGRRRLTWISRLRGVNIPLPDVRDVLDAEDAGGSGRDAALAVLDRRAADLQRELGQVEALRASLRQEAAVAA